MEIPRQITDFIRRHHVLTLATSDSSSGVHCSNMFYAWEKVRGVFIFTSEMHTLHSAQALANPAAAASILLETRTVGRLQGLQLRGRAAPVEEGMLGEARRAYIRRFPYAAAADLSLWEFAPEWMKLTDNTLGFGKKIIWMKDE